jgi:glycogen debranching enzyme
VDRLFWLPEEGYLSDCLHAAADTPAAKAEPDDHLRPNQLLAITLGLVTDASRQRSILERCQQLLVPGAICTLANKPVRHLLHISWQGKALNDPAIPYWHRYSGVENQTRKPAYHNGTAWCWMMPFYAEAVALHDAENGNRIARRLLAGSAELLDAGCIGQLPEILDGSRPHMPKGCPAQAWSISEWVRVWQILSPAQ